MKEEEIMYIKNAKSPVLFLSILILIFANLSCVKKSIKVEQGKVPDGKFVVSAIAGIDSILGFSYSWHFGRKKLAVLPELNANLAGKISIPDKTYIRGTWQIDNSLEKLNVYTMKERDYIYNTAAKSWQSKGKGEYPNPLDQLKLILSFGDFEFLKFDRLEGIPCYLFSFRPNVYFLDPIEATKPKGLVWISIDLKLPLKVKVQSERNLVWWEMRLNDFDTFANLSVPFESQMIEIIGIDNNRDDIEYIKNRFLFGGFEDLSVKEKKGNIILLVKAETVEESFVNEIMKKGNIDVYLGTWPTDPVYLLREDNELVKEKYGAEAKLFFERGIETKPIIIREKIFSRESFGSFSLKNDILGKSSIYANIKDEYIDSLGKIVDEKKDEPVVIVTDGEAMLVTPMRDAWLLENQIPVVKGLNNSESVLLYSRLKFGPLAQDYTTKLKKKEE